MGESYLIVLSGAELLRMRRRRRRRSQERKDQLKSLHRCAAQIVRADRELESGSFPLNTYVHRRYRIERFLSGLSGTILAALSTNLCGSLWLKKRLNICKKVLSA